MREMIHFCYSSASILRCSRLSGLEAKVLIIPPALGLIFATALVFAKWGDGSRKHLLLTAEGWIHFSLALLEVLRDILPAARASLTVFKTMDTVIAATSFLPLLFYLSYLWLFTRDEILDTLPRRFQIIPKYLLHFFVPVIVILHEIASFVGLYQGKFPRKDNPSYILKVSFTSDAKYTIWMFLTSFTLALLAGFQLVTVCLTFYRLVMAVSDEDDDVDIKSTDQKPSPKGLACILCGLKFGAIETILGFPEATFTIVMTRRVLRFLSRAFLISGIVKCRQRRTLEEPKLNYKTVE